jgi:site-specific recombinase XerD
VTRKRIPKVHPKDGRWYYVDKNQWIGLSRISEGVRELHRRLATLTDQAPNTLASIFVKFADSQAFKELKRPTQQQYEYFLFGTSSGEGILTKTFGHMLPSEIDDGTIAQYLERRKKSDAAVSGNRERSCLSSVFEFAMRNGWAKRNPCRGVRRNKERGSKVHIESEALSAGMDKAPDHFARVMQLAYIIGPRQTDSINLRISDLTPKGIEYTESKTGKRVTHEWTPTLRELVREILEARHVAMTRQNKNPKRPRKLPEHDFLLTNRFGKPLTMWGIISNMRRLEAGFSYRAIRPKAQTDGGDRNVIGHTGQMRERYTRRKKLVPVR